MFKRLKLKTLRVNFTDFFQIYLMCLTDCDCKDKTEKVCNYLQRRG